MCGSLMAWGLTRLFHLKNAKLWKNSKNQGEINRNETVKIRDYLGIKYWTQWSDYHHRSLV
jgi:hypothetical protein